LVVAGVVLSGQTAVGAELVAIVEEVQGSVKTLEPFTFLVAGTEIRLPPDATLVLGYLRSCTRETITGGRVVVGTDESLVDGGSLLRETVECDGGRLQLTPAQAMASGVMPVRKLPKPAGPPVTVYGASPLFVLAASGQVRIERIDASGEPHEFAADGAPGTLVLLDLDRQHVSLVPNATYRASSGDRQRVFTIARSAKPGPEPAVSRLVPLE
jgi:hypothetical protein